MLHRDASLNRVERLSPTAFVVGGVGVLSLAVAGALDVAGIASSPGWLHTVFLLSGLWFIYVGLVGFRTRVADSAPRLSLAGQVLGAVGWAALTVAFLGAVVAALTTQRTFADPGPWAPPFLVGAFVLVLFSFLVYGVASLRTRQPSRTVGVLLLVPVCGFLGQAVLLASKILTGEVLGVAQLVLAGIVALAVIALGSRLRADGDATDSADSRPDTPA